MPCVFAPVASCVVRAPALPNPRRGAGWRTRRTGRRFGRASAALRPGSVGGARRCVPPRHGSAVHPGGQVRGAALGRRWQELRPCVVQGG
eukprot:gene5400-biopygen23712